MKKYLAGVATGFVLAEVRRLRTIYLLDIEDADRPGHDAAVKLRAAYVKALKDLKVAWNQPKIDRQFADIIIHNEEPTDGN